MHRSANAETDHGWVQQYIPVVNAGELEFGISNIPQYDMARNGTGLSKGTKHENLQLIATIMKFTVSPVVGLKSGITKVADLKGKRMAVGFKGAPRMNTFIMVRWQRQLTPADIKPVPQVGLVQHGRHLWPERLTSLLLRPGQLCETNECKNRRWSSSH